MKIPAVKALAKHLRDASPDHFAPIYLIVAKESFAREEALALLLKQFSTQSVKVFDGAKFSINELFSELNTYSFFSGKTVVVVRRLDEVLKPALKQLETYLASPHRDVFLIMEAEEINRATNIYKLSEKNGVILDVPEEKPWEKQKAVEEWIAEQGKVAPDAIQLMIQQLGTDSATLHHELEKLSLYIGERKQITVADVKAVCGAVNTQNIWQLGDAIFKNDPPQAMKIAHDLLQDGLSFFSLIRSLRSQFQTKFQICSILTHGGTPADVACHFPYMKGRILDQNCSLAHNYGMERFRTAILLIDETEAFAKSITDDDKLLTERLIAKLTK